MAILSPQELLHQLELFNRSESSSSSLLDHKLREDIHNAARQLAYQLEDPLTAVVRLTVGQVIESIVMKISFDIGLFPLLASNEKPRLVADLAANTQTDPALLLRILRYLETHGIAHENNGTYSLSRTCSLFGDPIFAKAANVTIDLIAPIARAVPGLIADNGRKNPKDRLNGATQRAFNAPGEEPWKIFAREGASDIQSISYYLGATSSGRVKIDKLYPVRERLIRGFEGGETGPMWVDIGGGIGEFTRSLREAFPDLPGRCIVQDQTAVVDIAKTKDPEGQVEFLAHDFFTEQPVKGARAYYIRQCLHNWQDENCRVILEHIRDAMTSGYSRLLIHEIVLPETGASVFEVVQDWLMMAGYSTLERSEKQWRALVESAGLRVSKIYVKEPVPECLIEVIKD